MRGAASELVLCFYARVPLDGLESTGDTGRGPRLGVRAAWPDSAAAVRDLRRQWLVRHVGDLEFLTVWLGHPEFRMVK